MSGVNYELRKIPPVTRFLCISSLVITVGIACEILPYDRAHWDWTLAVKKFQLWRYYTSFFIDRFDIWYLFDLAMLYLNSRDLETDHFAARSQDYAWSLLLSTTAITAINHPLKSTRLFTPLLFCITYLRCQLVIPGHQTSLYGLVSLPTVYYPFFLLLVELFTRGKQGLLHAITGVIVGHAWYWGVWDTRALWNAARAPVWVKKFVANGPMPSFGVDSGVHVFAPKERPKKPKSQGATTWTGSHKWGSGNKLGSD